MIPNIWTDIIEISRMADKIERNEYFKTHVFSPLEIAYCEKQKQPEKHFAARWAVKEAFLKSFWCAFYRQSLFARNRNSK